MFASIGGYGAGTANFSIVANDATKLSKFVSNCVALAQSYDGIDIDWEFPQ